MKKITSLLLASIMTVMVFSLAACAKKEEATSEEPEKASSTAQEAPPEEEILDVAFLTGLEKGADYPKDQRVTAIMVNNIAPSRPTRGLSEAKIITEIVTEGGITRFMAWYEDYNNLPQIGSIRSIRDQFFQLLIPFSGYIVHDGHSTVAAELLKEYEYDNLDLSPKYGGDVAYRDPARVGKYKTEYTEYTDGERIKNMIERREIEEKQTYNSPIFKFAPYTKEPRVPANTGASLAIVHSESYRTLFEYDNASSKYKMSAFNSSKKVVEETTDDNNGEQLSFDNLLVLFAPMSLYPRSELTKVDFFGGAGYYFTQGHYETVRWNKGGPHEALRILDFEGNEVPVEINPGKTYMAMVDDKYLEAFDGTVKSGDAKEVAADGKENNAVEAED